MYTVYVITNKVNGKKYVGQTVQKLHRRWGLHCSRAKGNEILYGCHLYNAMRKYGLEEFTVEAIATCETQEECDCLESGWIAKLDSMNPLVGYNMTAGGEHPTPTLEKIEKHRQKMLGRKQSPRVVAKEI